MIMRITLAEITDAKETTVFPIETCQLVRTILSPVDNRILGKTYARIDGVTTHTLHFWSDCGMKLATYYASQNKLIYSKDGKTVENLYNSKAAIKYFMLYGSYNYEINPDYKGE
jgi:hypothetical protein